jgi:ketosteroid isomerase-like protein
MHRFVPALSLLGFLAACQPAAPKVDVAAEEAAIRAQVAAFNAAVAAYDDSAAAAIYAPDAVLLPPNQGRQTGTGYLEQMLAGLEPLKATFVVTPNTIVIAASGDLAVEEGTWVTTIPAASGASFTDNGKYLVAWKKVNGTWLTQFDTWNSSNASASAEVTTAPANP